MTIIESVIKAVDETLLAGQKIGRIVYLTSDFPIVIYTPDYGCSTHAGKTFRKYIRSLGYVMVTANFVNIKAIDNRKIRGNKVVIIKATDFELYKRQDVIDRKFIKVALENALTVDDVKNIQGVIDAKIEFLLMSLRTTNFFNQIQNSIYRTTGRFPKIDRVALAVNNYIDSLK